jgi:hypothetical protein
MGKVDLLERRRIGTMHHAPGLGLRQLSRTFGWAGTRESARGLAQSKTWRESGWFMERLADAAEVPAVIFRTRT